MDEREKVFKNKNIVDCTILCVVISRYFDFTSDEAKKVAIVVLHKNKIIKTEQSTCFSLLSCNSLAKLLREAGLCPFPTDSLPKCLSV